MLIRCFQFFYNDLSFARQDEFRSCAGTSLKHPHTALWMMRKQVHLTRIASHKTKCREKEGKKNKKKTCEVGSLRYGSSYAKKMIGQHTSRVLEGWDPWILLKRFLLAIFFRCDKPVCKLSRNLNFRTI